MEGKSLQYGCIRHQLSTLHETQGRSEMAKSGPRRGKKPAFETLLETQTASSFVPVTHTQVKEERAREQASNKEEATATREWLSALR